MMIRSVGIALIAALSLLLAACGFQLRQAEPLPALLQEVRVDALNPRGQVARELARQLEQNGANLQESAPTRLKVQAETFDRQVLAIDERARVSEYELRLVVTYQVEDTAGAVLLPAAQVELSRSFSFDAQAAIGASQEEALIREELTRDAARQILLRVARGLQPTG
jgi:LPS-assembly lipoprotein